MSNLYGEKLAKKLEIRKENDENKIAEEYKKSADIVIEFLTNLVYLFNPVTETFDTSKLVNTKGELGIPSYVVVEKNADKYNLILEYKNKYGSYDTPEFMKNSNTDFKFNIAALSNALNKNEENAENWITVYEEEVNKIVDMRNVEIYRLVFTFSNIPYIEYANYYKHQYLNNTMYIPTTSSNEKQR